MSILNPPDQWQLGMSNILTQSKRSWSCLGQWNGIEHSGTVFIYVLIARGSVWKKYIRSDKKSYMKHNTYEKKFCTMLVAKHFWANCKLKDVLLWIWKRGDIVQIFVWRYRPRPGLIVIPTNNTLSLLPIPLTLFTTNLLTIIPELNPNGEHH